MGIITSIIVVLTFVWKVISFIFDATVWIIEHTATAIVFLSTVVDQIYIWTRAILEWLQEWLGPVWNSVKGYLTWEELKRAFILSLTVGVSIWGGLSLVMAGGLNWLMSPFLLNMVGSLGTWGIGLISGAITFMVDLFRRTFLHGVKP